MPNPLNFFEYFIVKNEYKKFRQDFITPFYYEYSPGKWDLQEDYKLSGDDIIDCSRDLDEESPTYGQYIEVPILFITALEKKINDEAFKALQELRGEAFSKSSTDLEIYINNIQKRFDALYSYVEKKQLLAKYKDTIFKKYFAAIMDALKAQSERSTLIQSSVEYLPQNTIPENISLTKPSMEAKIQFNGSVEKLAYIFIKLNELGLIAFQEGKKEPQTVQSTSNTKKHIAEVIRNNFVTRSGNGFTSINSSTFKDRLNANRGYHGDQKHQDEIDKIFSDIKEVLDLIDS